MTKERGKTILKYNAVIFDLDGTLLDSIEDLADSMNAVLKTLNFPAYDIEEYKYFVGDGMRQLVIRTIPEEKRKDKDFVDKCLAMMNDEYNRRWDKKTRPYEGIPELLAQLEKRNIKKAVLSNKPHEFTNVIVKTLLGNWDFELIYGQRDNIPRKPNPMGALEIAKEFGVAPNKILYLGDTNTDMQTACSAGMYPVGALWGFRKADELLENGAKTLIKKPLELIELL